MPKISIIMPVYNGASYITQAIESILAQTESDFEFLIVNDGSTDATGQIIDGFNDQRIVHIRESHSGLINSLNNGVARAKGAYIARMDADDISLPVRLEVQKEFLDAHSDVAVCGTWAETIDSSGAVIGEMTFPPVENKEIRQYVLWHNPFIHPSVMVRTSAIREVGSFRQFKHIEDYELWTRILMKYAGHNIPRKLIQYRRHIGQITFSKNISMRIRGLWVRVLAWKRLGF